MIAFKEMELRLKQFGILAERAQAVLDSGVLAKTTMQGEALEALEDALCDLGRVGAIRQLHEESGR